MSEPVDLPAPVTSRNNLKDNIDWVLAGDVVILHVAGKDGQVYHSVI
jgi:hypothetical protein